MTVSTAFPSSSLQALMFGSIGTLIESSHFQREAFNMAFRSFKVDVFWNEDAYRQRLQAPGGRNRIAAELEASGDDASQQRVEAIYEAKTSNFIDRLLAGVELRPGVLNLIEQANRVGIPVGLVSGTDRRVIDAAIEGAVGLKADMFALIVSGADARNAKPDPELYRLAVSRLDADPTGCVAIEDTPASAMAAVRAGIPVIHTPGVLTTDQHCDAAGARMANLDGLGIGTTALDALRIWHGEQSRKPAA